VTKSLQPAHELPHSSNCNKKKEEVEIDSSKYHSAGGGSGKAIKRVTGDENKEEVNI
jgi:hypothetical protein